MLLAQMYLGDFSVLQWKGRHTKHVEAIFFDAEKILDFVIMNIIHKLTL